MRRASICIVVLLAVALLAGPAAAQRVTGQIAGVTKDESGALMPGVTASLSGEKVAGTRHTVTLKTRRFRKTLSTLIEIPPR